MSLFKAREWWSTKVCDKQDEFDQGCLATGNLDGNNYSIHQIVVGSHGGLLQIYSPKGNSTNPGESSHSESNDLWIEYDCKYPILQVSVGQFVSGFDRCSIAVLHPNKLCVFSIISQSGTTSHGNHWILKMVYEHKLKRSAFNFCFGPFGQVVEKDFICIQSVDAALMIYEQENHAFTRFLPNSLLPGPIIYISQSDSFITVSSTYHVESYRYQNLAVALETKTKEESENAKSGKKVTADWSLNIGENALSIKSVIFSDGQILLFILGRKNLFCVTDNGKLEYTCRFDFIPASICTYVSEEISEFSQVRYLISTETCQLFVYKGPKLLWAAKLPHCSVDMAVSNFYDLKGLIVTLSEDGNLDCLYLGTDPAINVLPPAHDIRDLDYDNLDVEMQSIQSRIKKLSGVNQSVVAPSVGENDIKITANIPNSLDIPTRAPADIQFNGRTPPSCTVVLNLKVKAPLNNVQIHVETRVPITALQKHFHFSFIDSNQPPDCVVTFYVRLPMLTFDFQVKVIATYNTIQNSPRVSMITFNLPFNLGVEPCLPVKQANFKLTLDTNQPPANLNNIFNDMLCDGGDPQGNVLGFNFIGEQTVVTILASKSSQRYRIQADSFGALGPIIKEFHQRLCTHFGSNFHCSLSEGIPLDDFFTTLESHWQARANLKEIEAVLDQRAAQLRAIQRRLLTRFKDKTPQPLGNLDTLLEGSLRQLCQLSDMMLQSQIHVDACGNNFAAACRLLVMLINFSKPMSSEELAVLTNVINSADRDYIDCGIEEILDCSVTHMIRAVLSKSAKDIQMNAASLDIPSDTSKLKKHIQMLCEKVSRGANLTQSPSKKSSKSSVASKFQPVSIMEPGQENVDNSDITTPLSNMRSPRNLEKKKKKKRKKREEVDYSDPNFESQDQKRLSPLHEEDDNLPSFPMPAGDAVDNFFD